MIATERRLRMRMLGRELVVQNVVNWPTVRGYGRRGTVLGTSAVPATLSGMCKKVSHPIHKWMTATLDGLVQQTGGVFEAKVHAALEFL
jgi:hypothetical protein